MGTRGAHVARNTMSSAVAALRAQLRGFRSLKRLVLAARRARPQLTDLWRAFLSPSWRKVVMHNRVTAPSAMSLQAIRQKRTGRRVVFFNDVGFQYGAG